MINVYADGNGVTGRGGIYGGKGNTKRQAPDKHANNQLQAGRGLHGLQWSPGSAGLEAAGMRRCGANWRSRPDKEANARLRGPREFFQEAVLEDSVKSRLGRPWEPWERYVPGGVGPIGPHWAPYYFGGGRGDLGVAFCAVSRGAGRSLLKN